MKKLTILIFIFLSFIYSSTTQADNSIPEDPSCSVDNQSVINFMADFRNSMIKDDKEAIAKMISYPLKVNKRESNGKWIHFTIKNKDMFIEKYFSIITPITKQAILNSDPKNYLASLVCNDQGIGFFGGILWSTAGNYGDGDFNLINANAP